MANSLAHSLDSKERTTDVISSNPCATFESLMLKENVLKGLTNSGFRTPSPIQIKAIPIGKCGFDLIVCAKSGTGKTLVYSIIALEYIEVHKNEIEVLILTPTREIAVQVQEVLQTIGNYIVGLKVEAFIGGLPIEDDKVKCKTCHIAVGAPGRVKHLISEGILKTNSIHLFVLDEVDKLLENSFRNDINEIYNSLPERKQIITTSATYPNDLQTFLCNYMLSPTYITIEHDSPLLLGLKQFVKIVKPHPNIVQQMKIKNDEIVNILTNTSFFQCLVFTNYQIRAESISNLLNQRGWSSTYISAAKSQSERLATVKELKDLKCRILLSTDLTARGIDASNVDLVINYDIPLDAMTYLHRMGRAGRYGSSGICINLAFDGAEFHCLQNIIGTIGGPSLAIPKLPDFNGKVLDLSKMEIPPENYIYGNMPKQNLLISNVPKQYIYDLKQKQHDLPICKKKVFEINDEIYSSGGTEKQCEQEDYVVKTLNKNKIEEEVICQQMSNVDTATILKSLAMGELMQSKICCDISSNSSNNDAPKKIKVLNDDKNMISHDANVLKSTCHKNRALLCLSQILSDEKCTVTSRYNLDCIRIYLNNLKHQETKEIRQIMLANEYKNTIDLLHNFDKCSSKDSETSPVSCEFSSNDCENSSSVEDISNLEWIFKLGYEYATKSECQDWQTYLPNLEIKRFQNLFVNKQMFKGSECENRQGDEYIDCEMNDSDKDSNMRSFDAVAYKEDSNEDFMKWVPVETSEKCNILTVNSDSSNWTYLQTHFNHCSELLWQKGLSFQNVDHFDNWFFNQWQTQVYAVRNFIQQNIYVTEMKTYQEQNNLI